jgi:hypothetical protein
MRYLTHGQNTHRLIICRSVLRSMIIFPPGSRRKRGRYSIPATMTCAVESLCAMFRTPTFTAMSFFIVVGAHASATVIQFGRDGAERVTDARLTSLENSRDELFATRRFDWRRYRALSEVVALRHAGADGVAAAGLDAVGFAALFTALVNRESRFNPAAVSPKGAQGLGQLMPSTAAELGVADPFDPEANLDGAARYLVRQLAAFGDVTLALAAYNAGPHRVIQYGGVPPFPETRAYIAAISNEAGLDAADASPLPPEMVPTGATPAVFTPPGVGDGAEQRSPSVWQY